MTQAYGKSIAMVGVKLGFSVRASAMYAVMFIVGVLGLAIPERSSGFEWPLMSAMMGVAGFIGLALGWLLSLTPWFSPLPLYM